MNDTPHTFSHCPTPLDAETFFAYAEQAEAAGDTQGAFNFYHRAAEQGHAEAQCSLARYYMVGAGVSQNETLAVMWYTRAAEKGCAEAQSALGHYLSTTDDVIAQFDGFDLMLAAAKQGYDQDYFTLGLCYLRGLVVHKDATKAIAWFKKDVEAGNPIAALKIAEIYKSGDGVPPDEAKAKMWSDIAAKMESDKEKSG